MHLPQDHSGAKTDEHLVELWLTGRPASTSRSYRHTALRFLRALPGGLRAATVADVAAWAKALEGSENYRARRVIAVKSLLTFAERTGYCVFNLGVVLRTPRIQRSLHDKILEEGEVKQLISAADEGRDRALVAFLYASACRVSEAVGVNFGDILQGAVVLRGKGGRTRTVPVSPAVLAQLRALQGPLDVDRTPVFRNYRGSRLSTRFVQKIMEKVRGEVTVRGVTPHWMRHAHATHSLDRGAPLHRVQAQLGHANISTTSTYLHVRNGEGTAGYLDI